jgi:hypothetical protein
VICIAISRIESFHPSAQQAQAQYMNVELDAERRLQALVAKDRIRIKEFFIDFDKLRKGFVGEAAVSTNTFLVTHHSVNFKFKINFLRNYVSVTVFEKWKY